MRTVIRRAVHQSTCIAPIVKIKAAITILVAGVVSPNLFACSELHVDDLRFVRALPEMPMASEVGDEFATWLRGRQTFRLVMSTSTDIRAVAREYGLNVRAEVKFCETPQRDLTTWRFVFDSEGAILQGGNHGPDAAGKEIWIYVSRKEATSRDIETGDLSIPEYDLTTSKKDVCVQLHGRNMALQGFSSNIVVIDNTAFVEAR